MPFNVNRSAVFIDEEILWSAAGLDDIISAVVDSNKVDENPGSSGRYIVAAGTVLVKIAGDATKLQPITFSGAPTTVTDIVGVLGHNREFMLGPGITAGDASDEPVAVLHHGCDFKVSKLVGFSLAEDNIRAALPTCLFR